MAALPKIKRGDSFYYFFTWADASADELKSEIRDIDDNLIATTIIEEYDSTHGTFKASVANTDDWPLGKLYTDIQRTAGGVVQSSDTITLTIVKDITL